MQQPSPTTYALLGLLAVRSWTGYELTQQLRRSLRFVWPSSEGHLYREQKRLIDLGWATLAVEPLGSRVRKRYTITPSGRSAFRSWLQTEPGEPRLEIEGLVRMFYGDQGSVADMSAAIEATRLQARSMLDSLLAFVDEYLEPGGPLSMLETRRGGAADEWPLFHGRQQFPDRLHVVALVLETATTLLADLDASLGAIEQEVRTWQSTVDSTVTPLTRARLERVRDQHRLCRG